MFLKLKKKKVRRMACVNRDAEELESLCTVVGMWNDAGAVGNR